MNSNSTSKTCPGGDCVAGLIGGNPIRHRDWAVEYQRFEGKLELLASLREQYDLPPIGTIELHQVCSVCGSEITSARAVDVPGSDYQARVFAWVLACFNEEIAMDTGERNERFLEEALEMVQANGLQVDAAHELVDYVFNRPIGDPEQEAGGLMVTFAALCQSAGLNMVSAGEKELARINDPKVMERIRLKQLSKPAMSALPGVYPDRVRTSIAEG